MVYFNYYPSLLADTQCIMVNSRVRCNNNWAILHFNEVTANLHVHTDITRMKVLSIWAVDSQ